jgi:LPLT family lysophospholipid transporter-like MFS transporter
MRKFKSGYKYTVHGALTKGHETIGAGNALAVQNFVENLVMLCFVGGYSLVTSRGIPVAQIVMGFGLILLVFIGVLAVFRMKRQ